MFLDVSGNMTRHENVCAVDRKRHECMRSLDVSGNKGVIFCKFTKCVFGTGMFSSSPPKV